MFSSLRQRLMLGIYIFVILSIPLGAYFLSQSPISTPKQEQPTIQKKPVTATPSASPTRSPTPTQKPKSPIDLLDEDVLDEPSAIAEATPTTATSFGPTLSLKVKLEGRSADKQSTRLFVGIMEGSLKSNPTFVLSFTVNLPSTGEFSNLSLAGLTSGTTYSALLKGPAQIATSSAFVMTPTVTTLNKGEAILLMSGDLNEDNVINSADYSIARAALGAISGKKNWNDNADFNKDGVVNILDISYIIKNFGKTGHSGTWTSPLPSASPIGGPNDATQSATPLPVGSAGSSEKGYWIWVPK